MKRLPGLLTVVTLLAFTTVAFAQQPPQPTAEGIVIKQRIFQGPEGGPPPHDPNILFMASESFDGKIVKGAPYSGEAVTETIQTLADGNRIINRNTSSVYRDSEGRTRREQSLKGLGIFGGAGEEPIQTIFINDPVAGVTYSLDSRSHTAQKSVPFTIQFSKQPGASTFDGERFEFKVAPGSAAGASGNVIMTAPLPPPGPGGPEGTATFVFRSKPGNEVKEQLGKQTVEGVEAEGTRTTVTIPAGEIGNERAIQIVSERWYSPELQLVVMTRHSDPRFGETTYKLTNINRTEPAKSLFEVPPGYTVKESPNFGPALAPLRTKRPGHPE
jgi:hypothetical protein